MPTWPISRWPFCCLLPGPPCSPKLNDIKRCPKLGYHICDFRVKGVRGSPSKFFLLKLPICLIVLILFFCDPWTAPNADYSISAPRQSCCISRISLLSGLIGNWFKMFVNTINYVKIKPNKVVKMDNLLLMDQMSSELPIRACRRTVNLKLSLADFPPQASSSSTPATRALTISASLARGSPLVVDVLNIYSARPARSILAKKNRSGRPRRV